MNDLLIANILSQGRFAVSGEALVETAIERYGAADARLLVPQAEGKSGFIVAVGHVHLLIATHDYAMPPEAEPLRATGSKVQKTSTDHLSHVKAGVIKMPGDYTGKRLAALALVQVVAALTEEPGVFAVHWSSSQTELSSSQFRDLVAQWTASPGEVPIGLFARVMAYRNGFEGTTPRVGLYGVGFRPFLGRDIEFAASARPLQEWPAASSSSRGG